MGVGCHQRFFTSGFLPVLSYSIDTCPFGKAYPENIGIAVGIALLSSVETEIIVLPYPLPVLNHHLEFSTSVHSRKSLVEHD